MPGRSAPSYWAAANHSKTGSAMDQTAGVLIAIVVELPRRHRRRPLRAIWSAMPIRSRWPSCAGASAFFACCRSPAAAREVAAAERPAGRRQCSACASSGCSSFSTISRSATRPRRAPASRFHPAAADHGGRCPARHRAVDRAQDRSASPSPCSASSPRWPPDLTAAPAGAWRGELIMTGAVLCMAFYNVWSRPFIQRSSALGFLCVGMGAGAARADRWSVC